MPTPSYIIRPTTVAEIKEHAYDMLEEHRQELATHKHIMKLNPQFDKYLELEALGCLLGLAVEVDKKIVGYSATIIAPNMHYSDLVIASNDLIFLKKEYRKGRIGLALIRTTEKEAKERGAMCMLWHVKPQTAMSNLLERLGYKVQDIMYMKEIE